jgi:hypothetical protein
MNIILPCFSTLITSPNPLKLKPPQNPSENFLQNLRLFFRFFNLQGTRVYQIPHKTPHSKPKYGNDYLQQQKTKTEKKEKAF